MKSPTPEQIKQARVSAGLTQTQAESLIYTSMQWHLYEMGKAKMKVAAWELFQIKLNDVDLKIYPEMETQPTPEQIKQARVSAGLTQTQAAELLHKSLRVWQNYELGDRSMDIAHWLLFQIKLNQRQRNVTVSKTLNAVIDMPPTPEQIKQARISAGLTEEKAASMIHRSTRSWQFYEEGKRKMDVLRWRLFQQQIQGEQNKAP